MNDMNYQKLKRKCTIFSLLVLSMYAPIELTWVILDFWNVYGMLKPFYIEIPFLWIGYIGLWYLFLKGKGEK